MSNIPIRDVSLFVDVVGRGDPLVLMHGGPGLDHVSLTPFKALADRQTLIFYDHRCNGRSSGAPVTSMTWDNLTADADALRERLGYERWAVLGHSFGGHVALEYALRYPDRDSSCSTPRATLTGHRSTRRRSSRTGAIAPRPWRSRGASIAAASPRRTSSEPRSGWCRRTTISSASCGRHAGCWPARGG
jgi:pimeloyl-ACP methyl ester carboxylesterase